MTTGHIEGRLTPRGTISELLGDPWFFLVDFDLEDRKVVFARTQPEQLRGLLRVSARDLPLESMVMLPLDVVFAALPRAPAEPSINYLFHLPFSGSSFLTRHLEDDAVFLVRDPAAFDAVFRAGSARIDPAFIAELRRLTLTLFGRRAGSRSTVVRTAGYHPRMIQPLLAAPSCRRALVLYSSPEHLLVQVLKSAKRRRDVRLLMSAEREFVAARTGVRLELATDASLVALFWLHFVEAALAGGGARLRSLNCDALFADPEAVLVEVAALFGVDGMRRDHERARRVQGRHAKTGERFSAEQRLDELERGRVAFASEITDALDMLRGLGMDARLAELEAMSIR